MRRHVPQHRTRRTGATALPCGHQAHPDRRRARRRDAAGRGDRRSVPPCRIRNQRRRERGSRALAEAAAQRGGEPDVGHHRAHLPGNARRRRVDGVHARPVRRDHRGDARARRADRRRGRSVPPDHRIAQGAGQEPALDVAGPGARHEDRGRRAQRRHRARSGADRTRRAAQRRARALHPFARAAEIPPEAGDRAAARPRSRARRG